MFKLSASSLALILVLPHGALAQHHHSPYAEMETVEGTALTAEEVRQLRSGEGMGLAIAAELNHYPGPRHVLEMRSDLELTDDQTRAVEAIFASMQADAVGIGELVIGAEERLAAAFRDSSATPDRIRELTGRVGALRGELQAIHLNAHIATRAVLTSEQVTRYDGLRGYTHTRHQERHQPGQPEKRHRP